MCSPPGILPPFWNVLLWAAVGLFTSLLPVLPKPWGILFFMVALILRSIWTLGLGPALLLLGAANVSQRAALLPTGCQGTEPACLLAVQLMVGLQNT